MAKYTVGLHTFMYYTCAMHSHTEHEGI